MKAEGETQVPRGGSCAEQLVPVSWGDEAGTSKVGMDGQFP